MWDIVRPFAMGLLGAVVIWSLVHLVAFPAIDAIADSQRESGFVGEVAAIFVEAWKTDIRLFWFGHIAPFLLAIWGLYHTLVRAVRFAWG